MAAISSVPDSRGPGPAGIPWKDLASNIINRHMTEYDVLDNSELAKLNEFVSEENMTLRRAAAERGDHTHTTANGYPVVSDEQPEIPCSLVEYIIRRHGTPEQKMTDSELEELTEWFKTGGGAPAPRYE